MINSRPLQTLMTRYANFVAVSPATLRYLPIPEYDPADALYSRLAELSRRAHEAEDESRAAVVEDIDPVAAEIMQHNG